MLREPFVPFLVLIVGDCVGYLTATPIFVNQSAQIQIGTQQFSRTEKGQAAEESQLADIKKIITTIKTSLKPKIVWELP